MVSLRYVCVVVAVAMIAGCGEETGNGPARADLFEADLTINGLPGTNIVNLSFTLSGDQVIPSQTSGVGGTVDMTLGKANLSYRITLDNVSGVTRAELYAGAPNSNGTLAAVLFSGSPQPLVDTVLVDSALLADDFTNVSLDSILVAASNGAAYVQIATASAPQGWLRGQTAPSGSASLVLGAGAVQYDVQTFVLDEITSATLNEGTPGRFGDVKVVLFDDSEGRDDINGRLTSDVFRGSDIVDSTSIDSLITLIRNERTYINITTTDAPQGAIRGQVELAD